ncbi:MAG: TIGR00730 family Rossman fold protein [Pseudomonadota bacterium]|nr:TIGR00730 family Rossman fold protein [Pseudomonadota bacterium]
MKKICVFAGASAGHRASYADAARDLGAMLASYGLGLVYGGGRNGLMGRVADGAIEGGGTVIGIIPKFLDRVEIGHAGVTKLHIIDTMHQRKEMMYAESDAFIVLPGGLGTLDETMEITTWRQLDLHKKPVIILNIEGYWDPLLAMLDSVVAEGFMHNGHLQHFETVSSLAALKPYLKDLAGA